MARECSSWVLKINSPVESPMFNVLCQFDHAYANFKTRFGEHGGVSCEYGPELVAEAMEITIAFSDFTTRLSKKIKFRYFVPQELKEMQDGPAGES